MLSSNALQVCTTCTITTPGVDCCGAGDTVDCCGSDTNTCACCVVSCIIYYFACYWLTNIDREAHVAVLVVNLGAHSHLYCFLDQYLVIFENLKISNSQLFSTSPPFSNSASIGTSAAEVLVKCST